MNAFLKKEIRLLLPTFSFALVLAVVSIFFHGEAGDWLNGIGYFLDCVFLPAAVIMLALNSFGVEVGTQMFGMMLAQPVERQRIWQTKIVLLGIAIALIGVIWGISAIVPATYFQRNFTTEDEYSAVATVVLFGMAVFSGALWTVLLLRQVAAAFWFILLVPGALTGITVAFCSGCLNEFILAMVTVVLGLYSLAGFFFARWLFFRAQDLQWTGGTIVMPEWRGIARVRAAADGLRAWQPRMALWRKEIQLHQSLFVIAFVLLVLHLGVLVVRKFGNFQNSPDLRATLEAFWVLWLAMPFLVGCAAVAEERKIGTHEGQLCLPVQRRTQFIVKFLVVLGLSLLLGAFMPALLEAGRVFKNVDRAPSSTDLLGLLLLPGIPVLIGAISFYVSTMARNTLQTLAPAVLSGVIFWPLIVFATSQMAPVSDYLWRGALGCLIILPILAVTLLLLAYGNFQRVLTGWNVVGRNVGTIACTFAIGVVLTTATYHRFWEKLTPFEPPHGPARLAVPNPASLTGTWDALTVRLPDGKIWTGSYGIQKAHSLALWLGNFRMELTGGKYVPGTNWVDVKHSYWMTAGLKRDGTLWVSKNPRVNFMQKRNRGFDNTDVRYDLVQFGHETNWVSFLPTGDRLLLVKNDGTLWQIFRPSVKNNDPWPSPLSLTPRQIGTESNWAEVFQNNYQIVLHKTDGSAWFWGGNWSINQPSFEVAPELFFHAVPPLAGNQMRSTATISHGLTFYVGVRADGTFRIWADERLIPGSRNVNYTMFPTDVQIGNGTNWVAVAGDWDKAITLKSDGTLWLWDFRFNPTRWEPENFEQEVVKTVPVRLGTHSDWVAICGDVSLAADGGLWFWPLVDASQLAGFLGLEHNNNSGQNWLPLLDISRKPQLLGNVFSAGE